MKEEIKEILDEMINLKDYEDYKIYGKRANEIGKLLLDYITNLQEENERYKNIIDRTVEYTERLTNGKTSRIDTFENVELVLETILQILKGE